MPKKTSRKATARTKKTGRANKSARRKKPAKAKKAIPALRIKLPAPLENFLKKNSAKYNTHAHRTVFTTYDAAQTLKVELNSVVKTLVVQADRELVLVALPGNRNLDFNKLKKTINQQAKKTDDKSIKKISLASERLIANKITKKPGAVPPFGGLYKMRTVVDRALLKPRALIVNGGSFTVSLELTPKEFLRLSQGVLGSFGKARK